MLDNEGFLYQRNHVAKGVYPIYDWSFDPKTSAPNTALTSQSQIDFEYKNAPAYVLCDNNSIYLKINVSNSDGTNTVTLTFAELFPDNTKGIEWQMNGVTFYQVPSHQILF